MAQKKKDSGSGAEDMRFHIMMEAMILGITPEDYTEFYQLANGMANEVLAEI